VENLRARPAPGRELPGILGNLNFSKFPQEFYFGWGSAPDPDVGENA